MLLANFATVKPNAEVVDLCTGNGIIPFLLYGKTNAKKITGIEIQKENLDEKLIKAYIGDKADKMYDNVKNIITNTKTDAWLFEE